MRELERPPFTVLTVEKCARADRLAALSRWVGVS